MSMNGYRQKEPLDDAIEYKHPVALKQAINLLMTKGNMTGQDNGIASIFYWPPIFSIKILSTSCSSS